MVPADDFLAGAGFPTIPVFRGTFDGAGHAISSFAWLDKGSKVGCPHAGQGAVVKSDSDGVVALAALSQVASWPVRTTAQ
ncbi:MAG: hypothetical protein ACLS63_09500 [Flavonifractor plautii]